MNRLGGERGTSGLLGYAATIADRTGDGARIRALAPHVTKLRDLHAQIRDLDHGGDYNGAVALSVGQQVAAVDQLQHGLQNDIDRSQGRLAAAAQDARSGFGVLEVAIPVFAIIAGLLVLLGLERRIGEYR